MIQALQKEINRCQDERQSFNQKVRWIHQYGDDIVSEALDISP